MSKHTNGPWFINGNQRYTKYIEARIGGGMVQEVAACGPTEGHGEQQANARLIAAAPELLEALVGYDQAIRVAIKMLNRTGSLTAQEIGDELTARLRIACDSIAKARGEV